MFRLCISLHERRRSHALRRILWPFALSAVLLGILSADASAQPKPAKHDPNGDIPDVILTISHLNFDCWPDTITGLADEQFHYLPYEIHWGAAPANADSSCVSETPETKREHVTTIKYPNWQRITGSVSFERMNEDSLVDIVLYLWGEKGSNDNGHGRDAGRTKRDSLRALCIFGQVGLDSVKQINLTSVAKFQSDPYFAMELVPGTDLRNQRQRDLSGVPSYEVKRVALDVRKKKDTAEHGPVVPLLAGIADDNAPIKVHVYPNPSAAEAQIEADRLPPGEYTIEVVAVNGTVALRQDVTVSASRSLLRSIDVRDLASGYYVVRLHRQDATTAPQGASQWSGSYPIIVTR